MPRSISAPSPATSPPNKARAGTPDALLSDIASEIMADYLYTSDGNPRAFRLGDHIHGLDGAAIGRVFAEKAYRLDGTYVGAVVNNMIVDRPGLSRRSRSPEPAPPPATPPSGAEQRRPVCETFPDCFELLLAADEAIPAL